MAKTRIARFRISEASWRDLETVAMLYGVKASRLLRDIVERSVRHRLMKCLNNPPTVTISLHATLPKPQVRLVAGQSVSSLPPEQNA